jgi:hypothetical protein
MYFCALTFMNLFPKISLHFSKPIREAKLHIKPAKAGVLALFWYQFESLTLKTYKVVTRSYISASFLFLAIPLAVVLLHIIKKSKDVVPEISSDTLDINIMDMKPPSCAMYDMFGKKDHENHCKFPVVYAPNTDETTKKIMKVTQFNPLYFIKHITGTLNSKFFFFILKNFMDNAYGVGKWEEGDSMAKGSEKTLLKGVSSIDDMVNLMYDNLGSVGYGLYLQKSGPIYGYKIYYNYTAAMNGPENEFFFPSVSTYGDRRYEYKISKLYGFSSGTPFSDAYLRVQVEIENAIVTIVKGTPWGVSPTLAFWKMKKLNPNMSQPGNTPTDVKDTISRYGPGMIALTTSIFTILFMNLIVREKEGDLLTSLRRLGMMGRKFFIIFFCFHTY